MAQHDFSELLERFPEALAEMKPEFTSHEFIMRLAQRHQQSYIKALAAYSDSDSPFMHVHGRLSRLLSKYSDKIEHLGPVASIDIFGNSNTCTKWRKLT